MAETARVPPEEATPPAVPGAAAGPVRVVRVIARLNVGGPARHVAMLSEDLDALGFDTLLVHGSVGQAEASLEDLVARPGVRVRKVPELGRRISPWSDARALAALTRIVFRERPDVVHTHTAKAGALGRLAAFAYNVTRRRAERCVVVHTFHGHVFSGYFGAAGSAAVRFAERGLSAVTDRVIAVSASQKAEIAGRYRAAPAGRIEVIELGLDLDGLVALSGEPRQPRPLGFGTGDVVLGFVGRFVAIKNLPMLLSAFALASAREPRARLLLVGDGDERAPLERQAAASGLTGKVRFTGWQRDLAAVYESLDIGVLSSWNEGTPVALIEAMAASRPVVATAAGGVVDVVTHERTGLLVAPGDVDALAAAMLRLTGDAELRRALGAAGRDAVALRYARQRLAADVSRCYRLALARKRPRPPGPDG